MLNACQDIKEKGDDNDDKNMRETGVSGALAINWFQWRPKLVWKRYLNILQRWIYTKANDTAWLDMSLAFPPLHLVSSVCGSNAG